MPKAPAPPIKLLLPVGLDLEDRYALYEWVMSVAAEMKGRRGWKDQLVALTGLPAATVRSWLTGARQVTDRRPNGGVSAPADPDKARVNEALDLDQFLLYNLRMHKLATGSLARSLRQLEIMTQMSDEQLLQLRGKPLQEFGAKVKLKTEIAARLSNSASMGAQRAQEGRAEELKRVNGEPEVDPELGTLIELVRGK